MPNNIVIENEKYKNLNSNAFASYGSYYMVQLNLETHYTQKKNELHQICSREKMMQISAN